MPIPKIIHQMWIGPHPAPRRLMDVWRDKHPDYEYMLWTEDTIKERGMVFSAQDKIDTMEEICGRVDIMRWEILSKYGGVFLDADSICIEPLDDSLLDNEAFATWEHETARPDLVAIGTMGFTPNHIITSVCCRWIRENEVSKEETGERAWKIVGPVLLTKVCNLVEFEGITILPSYTFLPLHYTGAGYLGHGKVYAHQAWGSTRNICDKVDAFQLPPELQNPKERLTVLMSSYNSKAIYLKECLESIRQQEGHFWIDLVCINDGSDALHSAIFRKFLLRLEDESRWIKVHYYTNDGNQGLGYSLKTGVELSPNELIFRMDTDDIMLPERLAVQKSFMDTNPDCHLCGAQIAMFTAINKPYIGKTNHKTVKWSEYKDNKKLQENQWLMNHPTFCFRKASIIAAGNYDPRRRSMTEDFDLILRVMKMFGKVINLPSILLCYRVHKDQLTRDKDPKWTEERKVIINDITSEHLSQTTCSSPR